MTQREISDSLEKTLVDLSWHTCYHIFTWRQFDGHFC